MESIELGECTLIGRPGDDCSLLMESDILWMNWFLDLPNLTSLTSGDASFLGPNSITLSSLILNDWMMNRYSESWNSWSS